MSVFLPDGENVYDDILSICKMEEPEEEDELQAVAKHFGKDLNELTLEALIKLEQKRPDEEEENQELEEEGVPKRKAPSLASILGTMPSAATLGLNESISDCMGDEENGECSQIFNIILFIVFHQIRILIFRQNNPFGITLAEIRLPKS